MVWVGGGGGIVVIVVVGAVVGAGCVRRDIWCLLAL